MSLIGEIEPQLAQQRQGQDWMATSTGRGNTTAKSLSRGLEVQGFSWSLAELARCGWAEPASAAPNLFLWEILAQQPREVTVHNRPSPAL